MYQNEASEEQVLAGGEQMNKYDCGEMLGTRVGAYIFEELQEREKEV